MKTILALLVLIGVSASAAAQEAGPDAKLLFAENCAGCHGPDGDGSDEVEGLERAIKSFAAGPDRWLYTPPSRQSVLAALAGGVPDTPMHGFDRFSDAERQALADYVMGLRAALLEDDPARQAEQLPVEVETADPAQPSDEAAAREDAMFGESSEDGDAAREDAMFGEAAEETPAAGPTGLAAPVMTDADIEAQLADKQDPLAIGGLLFMQFQYAALDAGDPEDFALSAPTLLDLYVDGRPNDRVRAYVRGRLSTDPTIARDAVDFAGEPLERTTVALDQLWLKFDLWRRAYVTVGKQRIKWGTGRFWNPTDFLNSERLDPLDVAVFDQRLGVTLAKVHVPIESLGWNFYAVASMEEAASPKDVGAALRAEALVGLTEVALSSAFRRNNPWRLGADISTGIWLFDLRVEAALLHDDERPYYRGDFELPATFPEEYSRADDWIGQIVAGLELGVQYNDEDTLYLGAEYFFNDAGYPDASLYPWLFVNQAFTPFYVGRHYAALYGVLAAPGNWDDTSFTAAGFGNLSDRSFIARLDVSQTVLTYLRWNVFLNTHLGERGEFRYGLDLAPNPLLPDGLSIVPPLFELGAGLRLDL